MSEFKGRRHIAFQTFYCGSFPNCVKQEESELLVFVIQLEQLSVHRQPSVVFHLHPLPFGITFEANPRCHVMSSTNISVSVFYNRKVKVKSLSRVRLFATPWTVAHQTPLSMGFSRQESWSALPFLSPGDLPDPGIEPGSPTLQADALPSDPPGKPTAGGPFKKLITTIPLAHLKILTVVL